MREINVWDLQTRVFHWSLLIFFLCTLVTADILRFFGIDLVNEDVLLSFHIGTGVAVGILLIFRILWGFCGPRYSRFSSFRFSIKELFEYLDAVRKNCKTSHVGHNPAASWTVLGIIAFGLLSVISGVVLFGLDEGRGILRHLYADYHPFADYLKLLHLGISYALLALAFGHVSGVMLETIRHKTGIIPAMFTGKKFSDENADIPYPSGAQLTMISYMWVLSPLFVVPYFSISMETKQPIALTIPPIYKKECAACHMAFPPNMLPSKSWQILLSNLKDHFGEDVSIEDSAKKEIEGFLVSNAAEKSREESSIKFTRSIAKGTMPLRITDIPRWKEKHKQLDAAIYRRGTIQSKINCVACHKWAEYGSFEDSDIRIPRI